MGHKIGSPMLYHLTTESSLNICLGANHIYPGTIYICPAHPDTHGFKLNKVNYLDICPGTTDIIPGAIFNYPGTSSCHGYILL